MVMDQEEPQKSLDDGFRPPYLFDHSDTTTTEVPAPPYAQQETSPPEADTKQTFVEAHDFSDTSWQTEDVKRQVFPIASLLSGSVFLIFSIALHLFSVNGTLTLKWNSSYWPVYFFLSIPLLLFGWRSLESSEEEEL